MLVTAMKRRVELPLVEPIYSTYHYQGAATAVLVDNPSIRNWYLNQTMILTCDRKFLSGFTTPRIDIAESSWEHNPYLDKRWYAMQFAKGHINAIIRELLDQGYYVCFTGIDDYYVKGKSWYRERHFNHDGMICGYDQEKNEYCIYAYDSHWVYQKFWTSQKSFDNGRNALFKKGSYGSICGIKPTGYRVRLNPDAVLNKLHEYLDSSLKKYPKSKEGPVYGIAVHDYMAMYVERLYNGSIPYEKMDRRVFRVIWEHKKAMLERLEKVEELLQLDPESSVAYQKIVEEAHAMRMLYASHHMRRRDSVLPLIRDKLMALKKRERVVLKNFIRKAEGALKNEIME